MRKGITSINKAVSEAATYVSGVASGTIPVFRTPWEQLNRLYVYNPEKGISGYEGGSIVTFAGHSGTGKTSILCQAAVEMCTLNPGVRVLAMSLETQAKSLALRMISHLQKNTKSDLVSGISEIDKGSKALLSNLPIDIWDFGLDVNTIRKLIFEYIADYSDQSVILLLDHTRLVLPANFEHENATMKKMINVFHDAKKRYSDCLYVIFSQLNDSVKTDIRINPDNYSGHYPRYTDVYYGRELFQASDSVVVINNPQKNFLSIYGPDRYPTEGYIFFHVLKSRDGREEVFPLIEELKHNTVRELTNDEYKAFYIKHKENKT